MLKKLKAWINRENKPGTSLWKALLLEHRLPWRYQLFFLGLRIKCSPFYWIYRIFYNNKYALLKKINYKELIMPNTKFSIFIDKKNQIVTKLPYKQSMDGNYNFYKFYKKMKDLNNFTHYYNTLMDLKKEPFINKHICKVISIYRDGGYTSPFIKGYALTVLKHKSNDLTPKIKSRIILAINELIISLEKYQKRFDHVIGDWYISNLVYDTNQNRIINVDLEGFYYGNPSYKLGDLRKDLDKLKIDLAK